MNYDIIEYINERILDDPLLPFSDSPNVWVDKLKVPFTISNFLGRRKDVSFQIKKSDWKKAIKRSEEIQRELWKDARKYERRPKVLVIGSHQSGKERFRKCCTLYNGDIPEEERKVYQQKIFYLCMSEILKIVEEMNILKIEILAETRTLVNQLTQAQTTDMSVLSEYIFQLSQCQDVQKYHLSCESENPTRYHVREHFMAILPYTQSILPTVTELLWFPESWLSYKHIRALERKAEVPIELTSTGKDFTTIIPREIMLYICMMLDWKSLCSLQSVNKWTTQVTENGGFWTALLKRHFSALSTSANAKNMFIFLYRQSRVVPPIFGEMDMKDNCNTRVFFMSIEQINKNPVIPDHEALNILVDMTLLFLPSSDTFENEVTNAIDIVEKMQTYKLIVTLTKIDIVKSLIAKGRWPNIQFDVVNQDVLNCLILAVKKYITSKVSSNFGSIIWVAPPTLSPECFQELSDAITRLMLSD